MGVKNAGRFMHHSPPLKSDELVVGLSLFVNSRGISSGEIPVAIDASWVGHSHHSSRKQGQDPGSHLADLSKTLASLGFAVTVVLDGKQRHHSKRASTERKAKATKACIRARTLHSQLLQLSSKIEDVSTSPNERHSLLEERKSLAAQLSVAEKCALPFDSSEFERKLTHLLASGDNTESGKGSVKVVRALFQADAVIAQGLLSREYSVAFGNDSDFSFLSLGTCIQVTKFSLKKKTRSDGGGFQLCNVTLSSLNQKLIVDFVGALRSLQPCPVVPAKEDMTKYLVDLGPKTMSLIAVCLGCDQLSKGVPGFGPSQVIPLLNKIQLRRQQRQGLDSNSDMTDCRRTNVEDDEYFESMAAMVKKKFHISECYWDCIETSRKAFVFEPSTTVSHVGAILTYPITYIHSSRPTALPFYLKDFAVGQDDITIFDGPRLSTCVGPGDGCHLFMDAELCYDCGKQGCCHDSSSTIHVCQIASTRKQCTRCFRDICLDCRETNGTDQHLCLECHGVETVVPTPAGEETMVAHIPMNQLRAELESAGFDVTKEATRIELMELHEELVSKNRLALYDMQSVKYPFFASETLDFPSSRFEHILDFDFKDGGRFIRDDRLHADVVIDMLDLLSQYVEFSSGKVASGKEYKVHHILPDVIIAYAEGSRLDCGYRLLQRCVRHSSDSKMPSIEDSSCSVVRFVKDEMKEDVPQYYTTGLLISTKVPPSFKTEAPYGVQVVVCNEGIVACRCSCKAGSQGCNRHVDVHVLPVLYQLTLFLIECLAEHLLYEVGQWIKDGGNCLSESQEQILHTAITKLLKACVVSTTKHEGTTSTEELNTLSVKTILERFALGTEQAKRTCPPPPDRSNLRPLRYCSFQNPVTKFRNRMYFRKLDESNNDNHGGPPTPKTLFPEPTTTNNLLDKQPDYVGVHFVIDELVRRMHSQSRKAFNRMLFVGYQLIDLRRIHFCKENDINETNEMSKAQMAVDKIMECCAKRVPKPRGKAGRPCSLENITNSRRAASDTPRKTKASKANMSTRSMKYAVKERSKKKSGRADRSKYCCVPLCKIRHNMNSKVVSGEISMYYLPVLRRKPTDGARENVWYNYAMSLGLRKELRQRGFQFRSDRTRYICCSGHKLEEIERSLTITMTNKKKVETKGTFSFLLTVPKPDASKAFANSPETMSRGLGSDRRLERIGHQLKQSAKIMSPGDKRDALLSRLEIQKMAELSENNNRIDSLINKRVRHSFGLTCMSIHEEADKQDKNKRARIGVCPLNSEHDKETTAAATTRLEPVVDLETTDSEVKDRTGFNNMCHLISFIAIACNGDPEVMVDKISAMTWLEEWFYYFEDIWGRTIHRDVDAARQYLVSAHTLRKVAIHKQRIVSKARSRWPRFALHEDDVILRGKRWNDRYHNLRVNMWDTTDLKLMFKPSNPDYQRLTYSLYYGQNVGKGGVCVQLCGWITTEELWTGAISDTEYFERSGILATQQELGGEKSFVNIVDKGFRNVVAAWRHGRQMILQPAFAKSDRRFTSYELISSAAIAADRSANERAVKVCKRSGFLERGLRPGGDVAYFSETWRNWAFQVNFMFKPVL